MRMSTGRQNPMLTGSQFRLNAKHLFITYPQCGSVTKEQLLTFLQTTGGIRRAIIALEQHQDGNNHLHAYIEYTKRLNIKNPRKFDMEGLHPNITSCRNIMASINYCIKEDEHPLYFNWSEPANEINNLYEKARTLDEEIFFEECRKQKIPYMYANRAWSKVQEEMNSNTYLPLTPVEGTITSTVLSTLAYNEVGTSLWIKGPTGVGKTTWALRQLEKPLLFVRHLDTLRQFKNGYHKTIVFDDMNFSHLPRQAQIELVDRNHPQQIHVRYSVVNLPAQVIKVFLSNDSIFDMSDPAIARRISLISLWEHLN